MLEPCCLAWASLWCATAALRQEGLEDSNAGLDASGAPRVDGEAGPAAAWSPADAKNAAERGAVREPPSDVLARCPRAAGFPDSTATGRSHGAARRAARAIRHPSPRARDTRVRGARGSRGGRSRTAAVRAGPASLKAQGRKQTLKTVATFRSPRPTTSEQAPARAARVGKCPRAGLPEATRRAAQPSRAAGSRRGRGRPSRRRLGRRRPSEAVTVAARAARASRGPRAPRSTPGPGGRGPRVAAESGSTIRLADHVPLNKARCLPLTLASAPARFRDLAAILAGSSRARLGASFAAWPPTL